MTPFSRALSKSHYIPFSNLMQGSNTVILLQSVCYEDQIHTVNPVSEILDMLIN